jgi:phage-related protein|tara:strand:+ start:294 stop:551 length:258 start_codon:yes stop_codon:yes gene_type:complete
MSFLLSPIRFVFELIGFLISAAFVYGLAVIAAVTIIAYAIANNPQEPIIEYVNVVEETIDNVCNRIDGCRIFWDRTGKEICPDCE